MAQRYSNIAGMAGRVLGWPRHKPGAARPYGGWLADAWSFYIPPVRRECSLKRPEERGREAFVKRP